MEVELIIRGDDCALCGGKLRRLGEDVTEDLEYVPGLIIVNGFMRPRMACLGFENLRKRRRARAQSSVAV